jgi:hypothetical protein
MSLADLKHIDVRHLDKMPQYIILGFGLIVIGLLLLIAGIML